MLGIGSSWLAHTVTTTDAGRQDGGMTEPVVATSADHGDIIDVLATAFSHDPVFSALVPEAGSRPARLRRFFTLETGPWALNFGHSWILRDGAEPLGAAVILPSARRHNPDQYRPAALLGYVRTFGRHLVKAQRFLKVLEQNHPREEHLYLPFIGATQPGRGAGAKLMTAMTGAADEAGMPMYLEASSATSARLYRRHGYVDMGVIDVPDMPPLYPMWREPSRA
jgi:hypothetical protein